MSEGIAATQAWRLACTCSDRVPTVEGLTVSTVGDTTATSIRFANG